MKYQGLSASDVSGIADIADFNTVIDAIGNLRDELEASRMILDMDNSGHAYFYYSNSGSTMSEWHKVREQELQVNEVHNA